MKVAPPLPRWRDSFSGPLALVLLLVLSACGAEHSPVIESTWRSPPEVPTPALVEFTATAYAISGETASGKQTRRGLVAADPDVLPLGSRIRVHGAGAYSGTYEVQDTGAKIVGRIIDIYMPSATEARRFGRRSVRVEVLEKSSPRKSSPH